MVTHLNRPVADNFPDEWIDEVCEADPLPDDFDLEDDESIPTGLTLTPEEVEAACVELGRWQSVETFSRTERPLRLRNADPDFFAQPQLKFLDFCAVAASVLARTSVSARV
jgi:hypothetical protein